MLRTTRVGILKQTCKLPGKGLISPQVVIRFESEYSNELPSNIEIRIIIISLSAVQSDLMSF